MSRTKRELVEEAKGHILGSIRACTLQSIREVGDQELEAEVVHQYERVCKFLGWEPVHMDEY